MAGNTHQSSQLEKYHAQKTKNPNQNIASPRSAPTTGGNTGQFFDESCSVGLRDDLATGVPVDEGPLDACLNELLEASREKPAKDRGGRRESCLQKTLHWTPLNTKAAD